MKKRSPLSTRKLLFSLCFLLLFSGMTAFLFTYQRDEKRFTHITTELFTAEMKANTLNMHYELANPENFGIYDYEPTLSPYRSDLALRGQARTENALTALRGIRAGNLSPSDAWLWKLLTRSLENSLALSGFPYYSEPLSPSSGAQTQLPVLLAEYAFRTRRDVEDYLALLDQSDEYFASLLTYEQEKAAAGLIMPASFLKAVRQQCDTVITESSLEEGDHFLQTTFRERLEELVQAQGIAHEEAVNYIAQNDRLLKTVLLPAYTALGDGLLLLEDESVVPAGLAALPQGQAYYEQLLISETGSYRPVEEIQKMLTVQFTQEYEEIQKIAKKHPEIMALYGEENAEAFPYREASQMLSDLQRRMEPDFPAIPGGATRAAVKAVSPSLEAYCAPAFYLTAPLDDTDSNAIYINRKKTPDGLELYTTLAHEGYPGHLYQTVYFNRSSLAAGVRPARQLLWYGGYLEGWALYVEFRSFDYASQLLSEYGLESASLIAQLEVHNRSLQLCLYCLLDIMIHYEGASYNEVARMLKEFGITESGSAKSIYYYIVQEPCNYLKYYLGYLEILSLQKDAKKLWGDGYTDYRFHSFYLDSGPSDFLSLQERLREGGRNGFLREAMGDTMSEDTATGDTATGNASPGNESTEDIAPENAVSKDGYSSSMLSRYPLSQRRILSFFALSTAGCVKYWLVSTAPTILS